VLSELDQIKMSRRDKDLGDKAQKVIQRLKGYRAQGPVRDGVTVDRTITVRMIPSEPRMAQLPNWLDPERADDRILGSALEIQFSDLSAEVLLVTNDLNLQNKAEMAFLPWAEPPASQIIGAGGTP
jgi:predicted ribonuclease YlaK